MAQIQQVVDTVGCEIAWYYLKALKVQLSPSSTTKRRWVSCRAGSWPNTVRTGREHVVRLPFVTPSDPFVSTATCPGLLGSPDVSGWGGKAGSRPGAMSPVPPRGGLDPCSMTSPPTDHGRSLHLTSPQFLHLLSAYQVPSISVTSFDPSSAKYTLDTHFLKGVKTG